MTHHHHLLLRRRYSPMQTFASLKDFYKSALIFHLYFQLVIFYNFPLNIHLYTIPPSVFLVILLVDFPEDYCSYLTFLLLSILLT